MENAIAAVGALSVYKLSPADAARVSVPDMLVVHHLAAIFAGAILDIVHLQPAFHAVAAIHRLFMLAVLRLVFS